MERHCLPVIQLEMHFGYQSRRLKVRSFVILKCNVVGRRELGKIFVTVRGSFPPMNRTPNAFSRRHIFHVYTERTLNMEAVLTTFFFE